MNFRRIATLFLLLWFTTAAAQDVILLPIRPPAPSVLPAPPKSFKSKEIIEPPTPGRVLYEDFPDATIQLFSQKNFQGQVQTYRGNRNRVILPFAPKVLASAIVKEGYVAYLTVYSRGRLSELFMLYGRSAIPVLEVDSLDLRFEKSKFLKITFAGISTDVHSDACKNIFGKISLGLYEKASGLAQIIPCLQYREAPRAYRISSEMQPVTFFNRASATDNTTVFNGDYVFSNSASNLLRPVTSSTYPQGYSAYFVMGQYAFNVYRLNFSVFADLTQLHQGLTLGLPNPLSSRSITETQTGNFGNVWAVDPEVGRYVAGPFLIPAHNFTEPAHNIYIHFIVEN